MAPVPTRADFLRLTAATAVAGLGATAPMASAVVPVAPTPDDLGFVQLAATAELISLALADQARAVLDAAQRAALAHVRKGDADQLRRLRFVLAESAPQKTDFGITFPEGTFATPARALRAGRRLSGIAVGIYANGSTYASDSGTRALLTRLLLVESGHLAQFRALLGEPVTPGGLPPIAEFDRSGDLIDAYLTSTVPEPS